MIDTGRLAAYIAAEVGLFLAPGPSVVYVVASAAAHGRRGAVAAVAGNTVGLLTQLVIVVLVLDGALHSAALTEGLKLAGAAWLILLGVRALGRRRDSVAAAGSDPTGGRARLPRDGFVVGFTNPKGLITFTGFAPDLVSAHGGDRTVSIALLGLIGVLMAVVCDLAWGLASSTAHVWLERSERRRRSLDIGTGVLMIGFGVGLALITLL